MENKILERNFVEFSKLYEKEMMENYSSREEFEEKNLELYNLFEEGTTLTGIELEKFLDTKVKEHLYLILGLEDPENMIDEDDLKSCELDVDNMTFRQKTENIEKIVEETTGKLNSDEREILAAKDMPLVYSLVRKFGNTGIAYDELLSTALVGFAKGLNSFQKGKGVKFSTYAYKCISNEILYFLRKEKRHNDNNISMNMQIAKDNNGNATTLESIISNEDKGERGVEESVMIQESIVFLLKIIEEDLNTTEKYIVECRYGINGRKQKTQRQIAEEIEMSQANVSKLEKNVNEKLRKIMSSKYKIKDI